MSAPTSRQQLQTFLGLANYMAPFIPNLSTLTDPLWELLKESCQFDWSPAHQEAYNKVKDSISSEATVTYFDPKKEITLQVEALLKGLGAALLQDIKPVAFASKTLTDVEMRYTSIERELLAVVYRYEKFHTYLFGSSFTINTDHNSLKSIPLKHLTAVPVSSADATEAATISPCHLLPTRQEHRNCRWTLQVITRGKRSHPRDECRSAWHPPTIQ